VVSKLDYSYNDEEFFNWDFFLMAANALAAKHPRWITIEMATVLTRKRTQRGGWWWQEYGFINRIKLNVLQEEKTFNVLKVFSNKALVLAYCIKFRQITEQAKEIAASALGAGKKGGPNLFDFYCTAETDEGESDQPDWFT